MSAHDLHIFRIFLSGFFMIAGIALTAITPVIQKRRRTWPKAEAEISEIRETVGMDNERQHQVIVTYETADGVPFTTTLGFYQTGYQVGKKLRICYDPQDPKKIVADSDALPALTIGMGIFFIVISVVIWIMGGMLMHH